MGLQDGLFRHMIRANPVSDGGPLCMSSSLLTDTGRLTMVTVHDLKRQVRPDLPCIASERNGLRVQMGHAFKRIDEDYFESEDL